MFQESSKYGKLNVVLQQNTEIDFIAKSDSLPTRYETLLSEMLFLYCQTFPTK